MPDFRYALRSLARSPGFTLAVILTLAVGIAANTTIVTIASGLALRLIPAPDAERLVRLYPLDADGRRGTVFSRAEDELLRGRAAGVQELVVYIPRTVTARATRGGSPREILAYSVTGNYFDALGAASAQGRLLAAIDDTAGAAPVAVISHRMWTELGGRADLTGTTLLLNGATFTIVGVAPRSFVGTEPLVPDVWVPLSASAPDAGSESPVLLLCRLRPGARSALVEAQLSSIVGNESRSNPEERRRSGLVTRRATFFPVERDPLAVGALVLLATGLLLAAAAANVSNLVLAQGLARRREIAVRLALGAGRRARCKSVAHRSALSHKRGRGARPPALLVDAIHRVRRGARPPAVRVGHGAPGREPRSVCVRLHAGRLPSPHHGRGARAGSRRQPDLPDVGVANDAARVRHAVARMARALDPCGRPGRREPGPGDCCRSARARRRPGRCARTRVRATRCVRGDLRSHPPRVRAAAGGGVQHGFSSTREHSARCHCHGARLAHTADGRPANNPHLVTGGRRGHGAGLHPLRVRERRVLPHAGNPADRGAGRGTSHVRHSTRRW